MTNSVTPLPNSQELAPVQQEPMVSDDALLALASSGDLSKLTPPQRLQFYQYRCKQAGLDPSTSPFQFIIMNNKLVLYAKKEATDQIAFNNKYTVTVVKNWKEEDIIFEIVKITDPSGRSSENIAALYIKGLTGEALANAYMKLHTKACRRAVLAFSGLGMSNEEEIETVPNTRHVTNAQALPSITPSPANAVENVVEVVPVTGTIEGVK